MKVSIENKGETSVSRDPETFPNMQSALERCVDVYADRINPGDFSEENGGPYAQSRIERDLAYVTKLEQNFVEQNRSNRDQKNFGWETKKKLGEIFEAITIDNIDMNAWFGANAQMIIPTKYDDVVNGIDGVVEFHDERSVGHLALGIDVATSLEGIDRKLQGVKDDIDKGRLSKMDYFYSEAQDIKGQKTNIPQVILAADRQTVRDLMDLWVEEKQKALAKHYIQFQILEEAMIQLKSFQAYAKRKGKNHLVGIYQRDIDCVQMVMNEKKEAFSTEDLGAAIQEMRKDLGYQQIKRRVGELFDNA